MRLQFLVLTLGHVSEISTSALEKKEIPEVR